MTSSLHKRKVEDYAADGVPPMINNDVTQKDQPAISSSPCSRLSPRHFSSRPDPRSGPADPSSLSGIHFFVRTLSHHTLVLHADPFDTIQSIHDKIQSSTGIPVIEQRLIYRRKQLQCEQTLAECGVQNDAGLNLVGRLRSAEHPLAWQLMNNVVSLVIALYKDNFVPQFIVFYIQETVKFRLLEFLTMTPSTNSDQSSGHLKIFIASSAYAALVFLYLSPYKPNRDVANDVITNFVTSCKTIFSKHACHLCVPLVLELCRSLNWCVGINDSLYRFCRTILGRMVEPIDIGRKSESNGLLVRDIFPFLLELASKLSYDIAFLMPSTCDVNDFSAFAAPVRRGIKGDKGFRNPFRVPSGEELWRSPLCYEIIVLHRIFFDLLSQLEKCLTNIRYAEREKKHDDEILSAGRGYLSLLKELNSTSKLYHGCEEVFWESMKKRSSDLCYLIVRCATRTTEDYSWISECKEATDFEARRHLAMMNLPEANEEADEVYEMMVHRSCLLGESFDHIMHADFTSLRAGLFVEFEDEEATGDGVMREWFVCVCQELFDPETPLFVACPNDRRRFFPKPAPSIVDPMDHEFFNFAGKVIALALMHKVQVGILFDRVFFLLLAGHTTITLEDIRDVDPCLYRGCKQILDMDAEEVDRDVLGLTFVREFEESGATRIVELCPGGKSLAVNSGNRREYVDSLIQHRFVKGSTEQVEHFSKGFAAILGGRRIQKLFFECLNPEDLDLMLYGTEKEISVDDWKAHTDYNGFKETDAQISWFWKIVGNMTKEQKKCLLFFWTSIKYLPPDGFCGLSSQLYIYKSSKSSNHLPSSLTCFYRLSIPSYPSVTVMRDRLNIITQEHVSCSFGSW